MMQNKKSTETLSNGNINGYPRVRMRRNRQNKWIRNMVRENKLSVHDLIWPVFIIEGQNKREEISSMPNVERLSIDLLIDAAKKAQDLGITSIALFPSTPQNLRTELGEESYNPNNLVCTALNELKNAVSDIGLICDVALDPYTSHGHDGILDNAGTILNDETIEILCKQSINQAQAGADIIAPSDMMDGRIGFIRDALDGQKFTHVNIMAYSAKYASAFYGPFRDAVQSGSLLKGDKKTYQMDPANTDEAIREVALDIQEGADMVMIKPGLPYLDIIRRIKNEFGMPTFAYHVSGEYAMLKAASQNGWLDYDAAMMETLIGFKRAGADGILTYAALDAARLLSK